MRALLLLAVVAPLAMLIGCAPATPPPVTPNALGMMPLTHAYLDGPPDATGSALPASQGVPGEVEMTLTAPPEAPAPTIEPQRAHLPPRTLKRQGLFSTQK